jgi:membrane protein insertase Oxa1/YidC/SpoIIIJ
MGKSIAIAFITGISQFFQAFVYQHLTKPFATPAKKEGNDKKPSFQADFQKSMNIQMLYVLPVFIAFITYQLPAVAGIYWTTTNLFSIVQELITRRPVRLMGGAQNGRVGTK